MDSITTYLIYIGASYSSFLTVLSCVTLTNKCGKLKCGLVYITVTVLQSTNQSSVIHV